MFYITQVEEERSTSNTVLLSTLQVRRPKNANALLHNATPAQKVGSENEVVVA